MAAPRFRVTERQVLMLLLITCCAAFGGAFLVTGFRRQRGQRLEQLARARVHWMPPVTATKSPATTPYVLAEYFDPSLMSLPSAHGFSAPMWQRDAEAPPRQFEPAAQLAWLDPPVLSNDIVFLPSPPDADTLVSEASKLPATLQDVSEMTLTNVPVAGAQSVLRVEGALADRAVLERPNLPSPKLDTPLRPTRVRVAVAVDGRVRYAVLERSCGNESVDGQALEFARRLRFDPLSAADPLALTWGMLRFLWVTQ